MTSLLLVAATERELCGEPGLVCGIGPVEAAAATARALALDPPRAVLHVGVAGGRGLALGALVIGSEARYADLAAGIPVTSRVEPDAGLLAAVRSALPDASVLPISTSAVVGSSGLDARVEAMEGYAVLRACALAGIPAVEIRAISNEIGEDDRSRWEIESAIAALADALPRLRAALGPE
jgi:nucleoside phosphorylase